MLHAGYVGRVTEVSPICYSDPGMTNANMQFAVVDVDADAPENASVNPELEVCCCLSTRACMHPCMQRCPSCACSCPAVARRGCCVAAGGGVHRCVPAAL
jgi:hypothetical protein